MFGHREAAYLIRDSHLQARPDVVGHGLPKSEPLGQTRHGPSINSKMPRPQQNCHISGLVAELRGECSRDLDVWGQEQHCPVQKKGKSKLGSKLFPPLLYPQHTPSVGLSVHFGSKDLQVSLSSLLGSTGRGPAWITLCACSGFIKTPRRAFVLMLSGIRGIPISSSPFGPCPARPARTAASLGPGQIKAFLPKDL